MARAIFVLPLFILLISSSGNGESSSPAPGGSEIEISVPLPEHREGPALPIEQVRAVTYDRATGTVTVHEPDVPAKPLQTVPGAPGVGVLKPLAKPLDSIFQPAFGGLSPVTNPTIHPWAPNVRLRACFPYYGLTLCRLCSGSLIDSMHVLTAGHCVYAHMLGDLPIDDWASSIEVAPGYGSGTEPFGTANYTQIRSYDGWTVFENYDYDIALIDLDRPVGALSGWLGYGYSNNCSYFTGNTFDNPGYPGDPPYDGQLLYNWSGTFDGCEALSDSWYGNEIEIESYCHGGQSGSSGFRTPSSPVVTSVLSNGTASSCFHVRLTAGFSSDIGSWIAADTPGMPDLIPLRVIASPASVTAGSQLAQLSYVVHNYSTSTWTGSFTARVYLSTDDVVTASDRLIQTHEIPVHIGPKGSALIDVSPAPTVPAYLTPWAYWLGVILDVDDADDANNGTGTQDTFAITVEPLPKVNIWAEDVVATESGLTPGTLRVSRTGDTGSPLTVHYTVGGSATPNSDYVALPGSVTIPAGSWFTDVDVIPIDDTRAEGSETLLIDLLSGLYEVASFDYPTIWIMSEDPAPEFGITAPGDRTISEAGTTPAIFRFSRWGDTSLPLTITSFTAAGDATPGSDYVALPGSVTIPAGSSFQDLEVIPIDDALVEDPEIVFLNYVTGENGWTGTPITILSDDAPVVFQDDMEVMSGRWTPDLPWDRTTASFHSLSRSWTDSPDGSYANGINLSLYSQPIDLSTASSASLTFWHRYDVETGFDFARVLATADGGFNWSLLRSFTGSSPDWSPVTVDLNAFAGEPSVMLAFQMLTNGTVTRDGWYVDDLTVRERPGTDFHTVPPCRVIDTRALGRLTSGVPLIVEVAQVCGVPPTAGAVAANVTAVSPTGTGRVTLFPSDQTLPATSTLSFAAGRTLANHAILQLSADGKLVVHPFVAGSGQLDLVLDVSGYFSE